jgi:uncharacterized protein YxjI
MTRPRAVLAGPTYGVEIAPGQDDVLILAAAMCIDEMSEREHVH